MAEGLALIIEDSLTQAKIVGKMLQDEEWDFVTAKTFDEGREILLQRHPNLIFVDVFLAEECTLPRLGELRDLALDATIAVMTAGSKGESVDQTLAVARKANVDFLLRKPFSRKQLRGIVQTAEQDILEGKHRQHALVIDDSQVIATLTGQALSDQGFRVSTANSMEEALSNVDIGHLDLVVSDIFMPGMGGLEGIKVIKTNWPKVKVIAMSAGLQTRISPERAVAAAVRLGADAEIKKPFTPFELVNLTMEVMAL